MPSPPSGMQSDDRVALWLRRGFPVAMVLAALTVRSLLLAESGLVWAVADLRGVLGDVASGLAASGAVMLVARAPGWLRWAALLPAAVWPLAHYAHYEHVRALGAPLDFTYAGYLVDRTFLFGSALIPARPGLLTGLLLLTLATGVGVVVRPPRPAAALGLLAGGTLAVVALLFVPAAPEDLAWRRSHFLLTALPGGASTGSGDLPAEGRAAVEALFRSDLSGRRRPGLGFAPGARPNLLLVLLEGVSGAYLPSFGPAPAGGLTLPRLDALVSQSTAVPVFITQQRQTNRGEYALLCGDHPELAAGEPRLTRIARGEMSGDHCLPAALARLGYETVYLQAAPLSFMLKDRAMPALGFVEVHGEEWFADARTRSLWGVDDRTFFAGARELVAELEGRRRERGRPWFLTLLTAGTHHPYTLPAGSRPTLAAAMSYLDAAFGDFAASLAAEGRLDDTLVVVTSDESAGWSGDTAGPGVDDLTRALSQNHGFLLLLGAGSEPGLRIEEPFLQSDLALSLLDALGEAENRDLSFLGRSLFRRYSAPRPLVFANTYLKRLGLVEQPPSDLPAAGRWHLTWCGEGGGDCGAWEIEGGHPLHPPRAPLAVGVGTVALLRAVAAADRGRRGPTLQRRVVELLAASDVAIHDSDRTQMILGGQSLALAAGEAADIELALRVAGGPGWLHLRQEVVAGGRSLHRERLPALAPGDRLRLVYRLPAGSALADLEVRLTANRIAGGGLSLHFDRARVSVHPRQGAAGRRLEVLERTVDRAAPPPAVRHGLGAVAASALPACVHRLGGRLVARGCGAGEVIRGAAFYAPEGSRVSVDWELETTAGPLTVRGLLGAERPSVVLAATAPERLLPGGRRRLAQRATIEGVGASELLVALVLDSEAEELRVHDLVVEVQPP